MEKAKRRQVTLEIVVETDMPDDELRQADMMSFAGGGIRCSIRAKEPKLVGSCGGRVLIPDSRYRCRGLIRRVKVCS